MAETSAGVQLPSLDFALDDTSDNLAGHLLYACKECFSSWSEVTEETTQVKPVGGGITNKLFHVQTDGVDSVVFRRFGDNTEVFIDRDVECSNTLQLNGCGFGARLLASFANGRIECFLDGYTLDPADMRHPLMVPRIAKRLAEFHSSKIKAKVEEPGLWTTLAAWLDLARSLKFEDAAKAEVHKAVNFDEMEKEIARVRRKCDNTSSPVVFCHNDLLSGNIMVMGGSKSDSYEDMATKPLQFIDFEYGCYSYRGFDWGNHFNEWAGFDCEWDELPSPEEQRRFLRAYLEGFQDGPVSEEQVEQAVVEANLFSLASHMWWGVWAILQARYSLIDFDFLDYSQLRWKQYYATVESIMVMAPAE